MGPSAKSDLPDGAVFPKAIAPPSAPKSPRNAQRPFCRRPVCRLPRPRLLLHVELQRHPGANGLPDAERQAERGP